MSDCKFIKGGSKKYILTVTFIEELNRGPKRAIIEPDIEYWSSGKLVVKAFYEWDGPSGPAIDTDNFMDGSLVHDALYDLMRRKLLTPRIWWRLLADNEMFRQCKKDKMHIVRRCYTWVGVRLVGVYAAYKKIKGL